MSEAALTDSTSEAVLTDMTNGARGVKRERHAGAVKRVPCIHCHRIFGIGPGMATACRRHAGLWAGFERGKLFGGRAGDFPDTPRVVYQWDCCSAGDEHAPGCLVDSHESYDGELG